VRLYFKARCERREGKLTMLFRFNIGELMPVVRRDGHLDHSAFALPKLSADGYKGPPIYMTNPTPRAAGGVYSRFRHFLFSAATQNGKTTSSQIRKGFV